MWRNSFGADPRIIGETIRLDGAGYLVVGVMPASLRPQADVWTPLALDAEIFSPHSPRWMMLAAIGRLKPGIAISKAQADLQLLAQEMDKEYPPQAAQFRAHETVEVIPLHDMLGAECAFPSPHPIGYRRLRSIDRVRQRCQFAAFA
ncbi:MAG: hypothetical protein DMG53_13810 [Acidobacteria bacterium]|nr:MAG: hypothetical protein DMG53_13810 [Acidobacteriota bacterium]